MVIIGNKGFGLVEVLVMIVVIGIVAATALPWMTSSVDDIRQAKTEREMAGLAKAITGDPAITQDGARSDFGYVGDVGAFPPDLQALYQNPGGYATWDGPYLSVGTVQDSIGFKYDEWGTAYQYSGGITIISTGGAGTLIKRMALSASDYLMNSYRGEVKDGADREPGMIMADSVDIIVSIPNGLGGTLTKNYKPLSNGQFTLDSLPAGRHYLMIVFVPEVDTLRRYITVLPRQKNNITREFKFSMEHF